MEMIHIPNPPSFLDKKKNAQCKKCNRKLDLENDDLFVEYEGKYFCIECFTTNFSKALKSITEAFEKNNRNQRVFRKNPK